MESSVVSERVTVLTSIVHDCSLLPHFLRYYQWLGVRRFIIAISKTQDPKLYNSLMEMYGYDINIKIVGLEANSILTGVLRNHRNDLRQLFIKQQDWWIPADLDEFHQFPSDLEALIGDMQGCDATHCKGIFVDRLADNGELKAASEKPSLFRQYPWKAPITKQLVQGNSRKILLCRGDRTVLVGHHAVLGPAKAWPELGLTHHFKWRAGVIENLRQRIANYQEHNMPFWNESQRVLDYFQERSNFDLTSFNATDAWQPY